MVFLTFLGMFTNQYVPIWMKDNEDKHMNQVIGELSAIKTSIDMQILSSNEMVASAPIYSPIQLHADGVPVFASPTMGELVFSGAKASGGASASISYAYRTSDGARHVLNSTSGALTGGTLEFFAPNRYYVAQSVIYENGAILLNQSNGEVVLAGISMKISQSGTSNMVLLTHTSLIGDDKTIGGFGTKSVTTAVDFSSHTAVNNSVSGDNALTITIVSEHGRAWQSYFKAVLENSGIAPGWTLGNTTHADTNNIIWYTVTIRIPNVISLEFTKAVASVAIADIGV